MVMLREWYVQVQVECEDDARQEDNKDCTRGVLEVSQLHLHGAELKKKKTKKNKKGYGEGGVLEVGQLHLHRAELDTPADVWAARAGPFGRRLPAHLVRVRGRARGRVEGED